MNEFRPNRRSIHRSDGFLFCGCGVLPMGGYLLRNSVEMRFLPYTNISHMKKEKNDT